MAGFCSTCGAAVADGARFCAECGAPVGAAATVVESAPAAEPAPAAAMPDGSVAISPRLRTSVPKFITEQLHANEIVLGAFSASLFDHHRRKDEFRHDKFVLTTDRIIYFHASLVHKGMGQMPYRGVTAVQYNKGFRHGSVVIEAASAGLTMDGIGNDDAAFIENVISGSVAGRKFVAR